MFNLKSVEQEVETQSVTEVADRITRLQATLEYLFRKGDTNGIRLEVTGVATHSDVLAVFVLNEQDRILAATQYAMIGESTESIERQLPPDLRQQFVAQIANVRSTLRGSVNISKDRRTVASYCPLQVTMDEHTLRSVPQGLVIMLSDMSKAKELAHKEVSRQAVNYVLLFTGLTACIWTYIYFSLTRRVEQLVATTRQLASGDLDARTGIDGNDELAQVAKAIDTMATQISEDLLQRGKAEEALLKSEQRNRLIVETAKDAFITIDTASRIRDWNPSAEATFGWTRAEAIGRMLQETIIPPKFRDAHSHGLERFLATGVGHILNKRIEITALHRDGHEFPVEIMISSLRVGDDLTFNAFLHDISERKRVQEQLETLNKQLLDTSRQAGMAEVATGVLHNVGNVLNSVNVSATLVIDHARQSRATNLDRVVALLEEHKGDLGTFITEDPRGKHLPGYLASLAERIRDEQTTVIEELESLRENIKHINDIVMLQQSYAKVSGVKEIVSVVDLVEDGVRMNAEAFNRHGVKVVREYEEVPPLNLDKHKVLQILVNLMRNAKYACAESGQTDKRMTLRVRNGDGRVRIEVADNGVGIAPENLTRIFSHGFTTRKDGHGFGLHSGALAAKELGGSLSVYSDGVGAGARFALDLPAPVTRETS